MYAFQNERFVFGSVHHSFKVAAIQVEKGGSPQSLRTRFRLGPGDSPEVYQLESDIPNEEGYLEVSVQKIEEFSPHSAAILEVRATRDLEIVKKLYATGSLLGDNSPGGWNIRYATEFHMTNNSNLFEPRWKWEEKGYRSDEYGNWLVGNWQPYHGPESILRRNNGLILSSDGTAAVHMSQVEGVAIPLYQGGMIQQMDFAASSYKKIEGARGFRWEPSGWEKKEITPQYLMDVKKYYRSDKPIHKAKIAARNIARSTDTRTFIGAFVNNLPAGHSLAVMSGNQDLLLCSVFNSFVLDWELRLRLAGTNLSLFVLQDLVTPQISDLGPLKIRCRTPAVVPQILREELEATPASLVVRQLGCQPARATALPCHH